MFAQLWSGWWMLAGGRTMGTEMMKGAASWKQTSKADSTRMGILTTRSTMAALSAAMPTRKEAQTCRCCSPWRLCCRRTDGGRGHDVQCFAGGCRQCKRCAKNVSDRQNERLVGSRRTQTLGWRGDFTGSDVRWAAIDDKEWSGTASQKVQRGGVESDEESGRGVQEAGVLILPGQTSSTRTRERACLGADRQRENGQQERSTNLKYV